MTNLELVVGAEAMVALKVQEMKPREELQYETVVVDKTVVTGSTVVKGVLVDLLVVTVIIVEGQVGWAGQFTSPGTGTQTAGRETPTPALAPKDIDAAIEIGIPTLVVGRRGGGEIAGGGNDPVSVGKFESTPVSPIPGVVEAGALLM